MVQIGENFVTVAFIHQELHACETLYSLNFNPDTLV